MGCIASPCLLAKNGSMKCQIVLKPSPTRQRAQRLSGFSLVEVLISIVVLSFGLLGVAGLQAASLKYGRIARQQSTAVSLVRELAEMMRANPAVASLATGNPYLGDFSGAAIPAVGTATCLDIGTNCTDGSALATAQMTDWLARVGQALPEARVVICPDSAPYASATGLPQWACTAPSGSERTAMIKIGWTQETTDKTIEQTSDSTARPFVILPVTPRDQP